MSDEMSKKKPERIVALTQSEIDYVATYSPDSPVLAMLGNITALVRNDIRRINAEYILDTMQSIPKEYSEMVANWKKGRKRQ